VREWSFLVKNEFTEASLKNVLSDTKSELTPHLTSLPAMAPANAVFALSNAIGQFNEAVIEEKGISPSLAKKLLDAGSSTGDYPRGYKVEVSNDGSNWGSPVATGTGSSAGGRG